MLLPIDQLLIQPHVHVSMSDVRLLVSDVYMGVLQGALLEQLNMTVVWQVFDALAMGYAEACAARPYQSSTPSPDARGRALRLAPALSPQVMPCGPMKRMAEL